MLTLKNLSVCIILTVIMPPAVLAQDDSDNMIVGSVGSENVTYGELLKNYSSNSADEVTFENLESFLPIYLDYKAKIIAAKELKYHKDSALIAEYNDYVKQAAFSYWQEKEIKPSAFEEFKNRSDTELKAFHILITADQNASQTEINEVIETLNQAKAELENGTDPEKVNQKYSTVRNGRSMGGEIPWISAGRTVKEFEDQAYQLEPGQVSEPFKTQFGYHVILLQDKRQRVPARLVSHIYVQGTNDSAAVQKITEAHKKLESGVSWEQVLTSYSEDKASLQNNGMIGWVNSQMNSNRFIDTVMSIDPEVAFTEPKRSNYGYHIFRVDSLETYPNEEARDKVLREQLEQTPYYEVSKEFVLDYLEEKYAQEISDEEIIEFTTSHFPDFEQQSESFLNGLMVFKLNEEQLWNPAKADTSRLRVMYETYPENYRYPERAYYYLLTARTDSILDKAMQFVREGGAIDSLTQTYEGLSVHSDSSTAYISEPYDILVKMEPQTFSNKFDYNNRRGVFWLVEKLNSRIRTFDEALPQLLNEYQPQREQEWMEELREKYNVTPNYSNLHEAYHKDF